MWPNCSAPSMTLSQALTAATRCLTDTVYKMRRDTVPKVVTVMNEVTKEVQKPLKWWQKSETWAAKAEDMGNQIRTAIASRIGRIRRRLSVFP